MKTEIKKLTIVVIKNVYEFNEYIKLRQDKQKSIKEVMLNTNLTAKTAKKNT